MKKIASPARVALAIFERASSKMEVLGGGGGGGFPRKTMLDVRRERPAKKVGMCRKCSRADYLWGCGSVCRGRSGPGRGEELSRRVGWVEWKVSWKGRRSRLAVRVV